jgi:hypothetical protein
LFFSLFTNFHPNKNVAVLNRVGKYIFPITSFYK